MENLSRREAVAAACALAAACAGIGGCRSIESKEKEQPAQITSGTVSLGKASEFPAGTAHLQFLALYGIVVVNDSGMPVAVRPKCTHQGCAVKWTEEQRQFVCPCHGSRFSLLGLPTHGPAQRPLPAVACAEGADGTVTVDLTRLYAM